MSKGTRRVSRRNVLGGLGVGATSFSVMKPASAQLLPPGRRSEQHDVIVIGTGMAGTATSLQAKQNGADVIVLEKMPESSSGGNSRLAGGFFAIPSADTAEAKQQFLEDFIAKSPGHGNPAIYRLIMDHGREDVAWMQQNGVKLLPPIRDEPYRLDNALAAPAAYAGMPDLLGTLRQRFTTVGGKVAYDTKAKQLIMDNRGRVSGVRAVGPDGVVDYLANAVVIAAGGYGGNKLLLEEFVSPNTDGMIVRGRTWATGDGLLMAQEAGAGLANMAGLTSIHVAAISPREVSAGNPAVALPYCVGINSDGKRYVDESRGYVAHGKAALNQPGQKVALIFDADTSKLPNVAFSVTLFHRLGIPIVEANSLDELAGKINCPSAALAETVKVFNVAVQQDHKALGANPPKALLAYKVQTAPFYAFYPLVPGIALTFGGITTNTNAQALEPDGRVIPGLYAVGEGAGTPYYDDYISGGSLSNCLVMGRIAGRQAAAEKTTQLNPAPAHN